MSVILGTIMQFVGMCGNITKRHYLPYKCQTKKIICFDICYLFWHLFKSAKGYKNQQWGVPSKVFDRACQMFQRMFMTTPAFKSFWSTDVIWRHRSRSILVQVTACRLMASSHYLDQYWLLIHRILWHSPESNFTASAQANILHYGFGKYAFKVMGTSPKGLWVKYISIENCFICSQSYQSK